VLTPKQLTVLAEIIGFLATLALTYQTIRLLRHQKSVREMRSMAEELKALSAKSKSGQPVNQKDIDMLEKGAEALEKTIAQWDKRDQYFVFAGLGGLMLSFALKLFAFWLEP
jgi:Cys-tRNA synthase (O-phospho-L-seryl-tRNA:Cys-tRNA synthase)